MALSCFLCLPLPGRGGVSGGTCWSCSPYALDTPAFRCTIRAPAAETSSAAHFWVSIGLLLAFWPKHPVPLDTSHSLQPSFCSHRDNATTGCLHHPYSSPHKRAKSRQESGGQAPGEGRGAVQDCHFSRMLYGNQPQCWERSGASWASLLGHIQKLREWLLLHGAWKQLHTYMVLSERNPFTTPPPSDGETLLPLFPSEETWNHRKAVLEKSPNVCPQPQINIKSIPSRCLSNLAFKKLWGWRYFLPCLVRLCIKVKRF